MKRITIIVLMIITSFSLRAQTTYVPDDNFEQALINQGLDDVLDDYVATANIENLITLDVRFESISDLTGIEGFTSLTQLKCNNNNLTSLDLSNNSDLEKLFCDSNQLTNIDLSQNTELTQLNIANNLLVDINLNSNILLTTLTCTNNNLASLDISQNTALMSLSVQENEIGNLNCSNNTALTDLNCYDNQLTNLDIRNGNNAIITYFNASNNPNLTCIFVDDAAYSTTNWTDIDAASTFVETEAECNAIRVTYVPDDNFEQVLIDQGLDDVLDDYVATANIENITTLEVTNKNIADLTGIADFTAMKILQCGNNNLTSIDISNNNNLEELHCYGNSITSIDVSQNTVLRKLNIADNLITTVDVSSNTALTLLWCQINQITSLDVTNNPNLLQLRCYDNQLTNLDIRNGNNTILTDYNSVTNPNLTCIFVDDAAYSTTNWTDIDATSTFVETEAECDALTATYVPDDNFEQALIDLGYDTGALDDYVPTANIENLTTLNVSNKNIADLTGIEDFTALTSLDCSQNQLTALDVSANIALTSLFCYQNQLTALDVSTNTALTLLSCGDNQLTALDVSANTNLTFLNCSDNQLTILDVSANIALTNLFCYQNQLTALDVSTNIALTLLSCGNNQLTNLDVRNGNNPNFTYFNASNNPNLTCIFVDDAAYSTTNWTYIDAASTFVETQAECDAVLGVDHLINDSFMIYPNPVKDSFSIQTELEITSIEIVDIYGKLLKAINSASSVNISELNSGVYFIRITTPNGKGIHRIIKK